ncbi:DUF748 domain-containing protein [Cyanobacterium aponinum AL20118]|uniref:DUF3971 domain-containing protein n=1 Tax=Cyanobacterium aponinum AL20115 TaxID=3090662 RepID=A0AAF1C696_9CHRO|nr:DUF748 domain-containing protein [Cyanobacterium aponinum]WPF88479.1 hypothetical protein SAY89_17060 [Cyanobacterium aponinum AL20115]
MTSQRPPESDSNQESTTITQKVFSVIKQPRTQMIALATLGTMGVIGYFGGKWVLTQFIPDRLETELEKQLARDVNIGEINNFSFFHQLVVNDIKIAPTINDPSFINISAAKIDLDLWSLILRQRLPIHIIADDVEGYAQLDTLIPPSEEEKPLPNSFLLPTLPITAEVNLRLQDTVIKVTPNAETQPVELDSRGKLQLIYDQETQPLTYNIETRLNNSSGLITIKGKTLLSNTQSENKLDIRNLYLPEVTGLIPQLPLNLQEGRVNANLKTQTASLPEYLTSDIQGNVKIEDVRGKVIPSLISKEETFVNLPLMAKEFTANTQLTITDSQTLIIDKARLNWEEIKAVAQGEVNLNNGYNLSASINPLQLSKLFPLLNIKSNLVLDGLTATNVTVTGDIDNPQVKGYLNIKNGLVDKVVIDTIDTEFTANLDTLNVNAVKIQPQAGGEIVSQGSLNINLRPTIFEGKAFSLGKIPLNFQFTANLLPTAILEKYNISPLGINLGNLSAKGNLTGNLDNPLGKLAFFLPNIEGDSLDNVSVKGELLVNANQVEIINTALITDNSQLNVNGNGNWRKDNWLVNVTGNNFYLTPFVNQLCQNLTACVNSPINTNLPLDVVNLDVNLQGNFSNLNPNNINGRGNIQLVVNNQGNLNLDTRLSNGDLQITGNGNDVAFNPLLPSLSNNVKLVRGDFQLSTNIDELLTANQNNFNKLASGLNINADTQLIIDDGVVLANSVVNENQTKINLDVSQLPLNNIINNLPAQITSSQIRINLATAELFQLTQQSFNSDTITTLDSLTVNADVRGEFAGGRLSTEAIVKDGILSLSGETENIVLSQLLPNLNNIQAENIRGNFQLNSQVSELITFGKNYLNNQTISLTSLPSLDIRGNGILDIAGGEVKISGNLRGNQWQTNINTQNLNIEEITSQISLPFLENNNSFSLASLGNLNTSINLGGNLADLSFDNLSLPITIQPTNINIGDNLVTLAGNFLLINPFTQPDINNLQLQLTTEADLATLPLNSLLTSLDNNSQGIKYIPSEVNLNGIAKFNGIITANNVLTNPLGFNLTGDLSLNNFAFNQIAFESSLAGKVNVNPLEKIAVNLKGKEDIIATNLIRKDLTLPNQITIPFTPSSITINQKDRFFLEGNLAENNQFIATVKNLSLENLALQPVANYGIKGKLKGDFNTQLTLNLNDFTAEGDITINNPAIGVVEGKEIKADFNYQNNIAQLNQGRLLFANTQYDLSGKLNLVTQEIEGNVNLRGEMEDIFSTLRITDVASVSALWQQLQNQDTFSSANNIPSQSLGNSDDSIKTQVNLLTQVDKQIQALARKVESGSIPNDLDIRGKYQGEILIAGKLTNPDIQLDFEGNQWQWLPQQNYPVILDSLGLVMKQTQAIAIPKLAINANFVNNNLTLKPFLLNIGGSEVSFAGNLSLDSQEGEFKIANLPVDFITDIIPSPLDVDGLINVNGKIAGNLLNPSIIGNFALNNAAVEGSILANQILADFQYQNYTLNVESSQPEYLQFKAILPYYPLMELDKPALISLNLRPESRGLVKGLTQGKIDLVDGDFQGNLEITTASLNQLVNNFNFENIAVKGNLNFENTQIKTSLIDESIFLTGNINLRENRVINADNLLAKVNQTEVNISGNLPVFNSNNIQDDNLTVNIPQQSLNLEGLYSGNIDANIEINGTAFYPQIAGYLALNNGNFTIPSQERLSSFNNNKNSGLIASNWLNNNPSNNRSSGIIQPNLDNFQLKLVNSQLAQWGFYRFLFDGDVDVNGNPLDFENLRANGAINVRRGTIYIGGANPLPNAVSGVGFGDTTFFLSRTNENRIVFNPNDSILNPSIDIEVQADIVDYSRQLPVTGSNEIAEPIVRGGRGDNIQVVLNIDGELGQLLPVLSSQVNQFCYLPTSETIIGDKISSERLKEVETCVNLAVLNQQGANFNLFNSPIVSLSSTPNRSEGELINLIVGGQLINIADQLQNLSGEQLFENGLVQFFLVPIANNLSFGVNERVSTWGKPLGMKDLRIFPLVEGVYEVQEKSSVSVSYDYIYGEFKVRYQMQF